MDTAFESRMENWARTVRDGFGHGAGCCASWAAMYIASRSKDGNGDAAPPPPRSIVTVDQLDGWLVEAAVRSMITFEEKQVLRFWYVKKYPEHWIKSKLMLRRTGVRLVLARAENNLQKILANCDSPSKILFNNSHAGTVPRPESTDAHVGATLTLKNDEALID